MKSIKLLLILLLASITTTVSAQDDDWQIGGGSVNGNSGRSYVRNSGQGSFTPRSYNLWSGEYEKEDFGFMIGYVNKQWTSKYESKTRSENLFGEEGKRLHGMQVGLQYTPSFDFGLGMRTGLFYECYFSSSPYVKEKSDKFNEHDLYIPAQLMMRIPFTKDCSLSFFGGIGFQWAIYGSYKNIVSRTWYNSYSGYGYTETQDYTVGYQNYGSDGWPHHVNWQAEGGINLVIGDFLFNCSYSYGLTNHKLSSNELGQASNSRQDKMQFSIGYAF